jgi:NADH-quinone oxidoreductase subunit C
MTSEEIVGKVKAALGEDVQAGDVVLGDAVIHVLPGSLVKVLTFLKGDPDLVFDYLCDIRGVDYLEREPRFEAVYEFHSMEKNHSIRVRVGLPEENPTLPTVTGLWKSAVYPERELYDMFGITITGLANLKRLIMPEGWVGHPLRKDYPLTTEDVVFTYNRDFKQELVKPKPSLR